ncbi:MAG: energy transducer TonB [Gemmatimonadota bacterium]|nr:energy transducer TonB [Gemmatimonadota bacterium]
MTERSRLDHPTMWLLAVLSAAGCTDTVRPVLGGLKIGPAADGPFVLPVLANEEMPFRYPADAWQRGVGGETVLRIHIASSGVVDSVAVAESSGDRTLDSAAVADAHSLHYRPAQRGDEIVAVWAYLPVRYPMPAPVEPGDGGPR